MAGFTAQHDVLDAGASGIKAAADRIDGKLKEMERKLEANMEGWSGEAQQAYLRTRTEWQKGMAALGMLMAQIGGGVSKSNQGYRDADQGGAKRLTQ